MNSDSVAISKISLFIFILSYVFLKSVQCVNTVTLLHYVNISLLFELLDNSSTGSTNGLSLDGAVCLSDQRKLMGVKQSKETCCETNIICEIILLFSCDVGYL